MATEDDGSWARARPGRGTLLPMSGCAAGRRNARSDARAEDVTAELARQARASVPPAHVKGRRSLFTNPDFARLGENGAIGGGKSSREGNSRRLPLAA